MNAPQQCGTTGDNRRTSDHPASCRMAAPFRWGKRVSTVHRALDASSTLACSTGGYRPSIQRPVVV